MYYRNYDLTSGLIVVILIGREWINYRNSAWLAVWSMLSDSKP